MKLEDLVYPEKVEKKTEKKKRSFSFPKRKPKTAEAVKVKKVEVVCEQKPQPEKIYAEPKMRVYTKFATVLTVMVFFACALDLLSTYLGLALIDGAVESNQLWRFVIENYGFGIDMVLYVGYCFAVVTPFILSYVGLNRYFSNRFDMPKSFYWITALINIPVFLQITISLMAAINNFGLLI